ncbi:hypothetical protein [Sulfuriferula sp.]|uniref:hypothetical protein n=1 Tax=Sulfuriferula sp. TaxID=2025307 RepID=UPI002731D2B5|nr:hypothetical protein [Sulfuriferula sp.]MDP2026432.1 hypothetical protein [Sulfuriferula sp.]
MTPREQNRAAFQFAAEKMDELRAVFGAGVKLVWAREGGREIGHRRQDEKNNSGDGHGKFD